MLVPVPEGEPVTSLQTCLACRPTIRPGKSSSLSNYSKPEMGGARNHLMRGFHTGRNQTATSLGQRRGLQPAISVFGGFFSFKTSHGYRLACGHPSLPPAFLFLGKHRVRKGTGKLGLCPGAPPSTYRTQRAPGHQVTGMLSR